MGTVHDGGSKEGVLGATGSEVLATLHQLRTERWSAMLQKEGWCDLTCCALPSVIGRFVEDFGGVRKSAFD